MSDENRDPETGELFNDYRADRAQAALDAYIAFTGDAPDESHFRDLLCDLRHLAARDGCGDLFENMTFDEAVAISGRAFEEETYIEEKKDWPPTDNTQETVASAREEARLLEEPEEIDWSAPIEWSTGESVIFARYDDSMPNHHVSSCEAWQDVTGDSYVAVGDDGQILGCEDEGYPVIRNVKGDE